MGTDDCLKRVRAIWLDHPSVQILAPGDQHAEILFGLLSLLGAAET